MLESELCFIEKQREARSLLWPEGSGWDRMTLSGKWFCDTCTFWILDMIFFVVVVQTEINITLCIKEIFSIQVEINYMLYILYVI